MFANPLYCGQDPFVCKGPDGLYYSVAEGADAAGIDVYVSDRLTVRGNKTEVFRAFESGKSSADLWAPELWYLRGKWYIYYAGAEGSGQENWDSHRMFVLESECPTGPYRFCGELDLGERMSIDGTVMELPDGRLILFYMGRNDAKTLNCLYMAAMKSPTEIDGEPILLTEPTLPWESDICEGPFPIVCPNGISLLYSANAAHLPEYCITQLFCQNSDDILNPASWVKKPQPVFSSANGYVGPGHACIVASPDDSEKWLIFHSKYTDDVSLPGGWDRAVNILPVTVDDSARVSMQKITTYGSLLDAPSGEQDIPRGQDISVLAEEWCSSLSDFCYARTKTYFQKPDGLMLDGTVFPQAECKLLTQENYVDFQLSVDMKLISPNGCCGILFRAEHAYVGVNAWEGYALVLTPNEMRLVRCDGEKITVLQSVPKSFSGETVTVHAEGNRIGVFCAEKCLMSCEDQAFQNGKIGLYAQNGVGLFGKVTVKNL